MLSTAYCSGFVNVAMTKYSAKSSCKGERVSSARKLERADSIASVPGIERNECMHARALLSSPFLLLHNSDPNLGKGVASFPAGSSHIH